MEPQQLKSASKFLSLILRHRPEVVGVTLDEAGWTDVYPLLTAIQREKPWYTRDTLNEVVSTNNKRRFEFDDTGMRIRARQGHSVEVELGYTETDPPELLYHGTAQKHLEPISRQGILRMNRHHVHLSADTETATAVGTRHGKPVVLVVKAAEMVKAGHSFYVTDNGVWLTEHVPTEYID